MEPVKPAVETPVQPAAPVQPTVETPAPAAVPAQDDLAAKLAEKEAELKKLAEERDNYKNGLLKAKGKLTEEPSGNDDPQLSEEERMRKIVREEMMATQEAKLLAEKEAILQQALKENREMKIALGSKQGIKTSGDGAPSDNKVATPQYFSDEQINDLKARGFDEAKIKKLVENMQNMRGR